MQEYTLKASAQDSGKRLDLFLLEFSKNKNLGFSRTFIQGLIRNGRVILKDQGLIIPHHKVKTDDELKIYIENIRNLKSQLDFITKEMAAN